MDWYIGEEWNDRTRGLHKKVLNLQFHHVEKPLSNSTVLFKITKQCANLRGRPSKYLENSEIEKHILEMGTAVTPIDCYLEIILQQFLPGETSTCSIETKTGERLQFDLKLESIISNSAVEKLSAAEVYKLAMRYKENGVVMFKAYSKFAFDYFVRAAKLLITYKPFDKLDKPTNGIEGSEMETLFVQIQTNLAACLLKEKRYEHVIYHTEFVETQDNPSEKSMYRRALAFYSLKEFEKAQQTIERVPNYEEKREFAKLLDDISTSWKSSNANYKLVMQRMFK
ncbi:hypothetical protein KR093_005492 [Drosophila rubida]|uniref:BDBT FKBP like N-terminal domain-containing protein n=1 Tax=Drosophila rubida TaxID=30044 RepID=A0AAD4JV80_9MUSC|nr:hypothetical protein KR093_005492 [Drosophila rubida]